MKNEKRSFTLTVFMILAAVVTLVLGTVLVLRLWSAWRLEKTEADLAAISLAGGESPAAFSPAQLEAAAVAAQGLSWSREEQTALMNLCSRPLAQWSEEDDALVAAVVERNQLVLEEVAAALLSVPEIEPVPPDEDAPFDPRDFSNVGKVALPLVQTARLADAAARSAIRAKQAEAAIADLTLLKNLAEGLQGNKKLIEALTGFHVENLLNSVLLELVATDHPLFADQLHLLAGFMPQTNAREGLRQTYITDFEELNHRLRAMPEEEPQGFVARTLAPIITPILEYRQQAMMLENLNFVLDRVDTPFGADPESFMNPPEPPWWQLFRRVSQFGRSSQLNGIGRCQATAARRQVLNAAIAMKSGQWPRGTFPDQRPDLEPLTTPDPLTGRPLEYLRLPDGRLQLGVANGSELLTMLIPHGNNTWLDPVMLTPPE